MKERLPTKRCFVYQIEVGGESFIGMTTLTPEEALSNHIARAREGDPSKLHKAMRRLGYICEVEMISAHDTEVECLISKVSQIKKNNPTLNSTFGGEGFNFNLVELPNNQGEMILYVEDKSIKRKLELQRQKQQPDYYWKLLVRIRDRYNKLEGLLPKQRTMFGIQIWPIKEPDYYHHINPSLADMGIAPATLPPELGGQKMESFFFRGDVHPERERERDPAYRQFKEQRKKEVIRKRTSDYLKLRKLRYGRLRVFSPETQRLIQEQHQLSEFLAKCSMKWRAKSPTVIVQDTMKIGNTTRKYTPNFVKEDFNAPAFPGVERLFTFENSQLEPQEIFIDQAAAAKWLQSQKWFRDAIATNVIRPNDAIAFFSIDAGRYGGFMGMFTKQNCRYVHVLVDKAMVDQINALKQ